MKKERPDLVVYSEENGYYANSLNYGTSVGAPSIKIDNLVSWKSRGIEKVNKEFESKFSELKAEYDKLIEEFQWNDFVYKTRFSFEPVIGEIYHLYLDKDGVSFLSLIAPEEWNKKYVATLQLNSDKKWVVLKKEADFSF